MHATSAARSRRSLPAWALDLTVPVPVQITTATYLAADRALANAASVVARMTAQVASQDAELTALRAELTTLGYLPLPRQ